MSTAVNKKRAMLSSSFTKQLVIADINCELKISLTFIYLKKELKRN